MPEAFAPLADTCESARLKAGAAHSGRQRQPRRFPFQESLPLRAKQRINVQKLVINCKSDMTNILVKTGEGGL